jgi:uncharacterized membrane protein YqjE
LAGSLLGLFQVRLELLSVEAREEVSRLGGLLLYGTFAVVFLSLGLGFLAILITVALWDSQRLLALGIFSTLFLTLGVVTAFLARDRLQQGSRLFAASLEELQRDQDSLRP